tara:strand:- start:1527 stop:2348 length:822 start_codon:yes stop_codon:yes gene_type:complete
MQNKFFTVTAAPDIVNGDISNFMTGGSGSPSAVEIEANDIVFDWAAIDIPKGVNLLRSVSVWINSEDGAVDADHEAYEFLIAKAFNGKAPESLGTPGAAITAGHLRANLIGAFKLENTDDKTITAAGPLLGGEFYTVTSNATAVATPNWGNSLPFVIDCEGSGTNPGYDKIYIACVTKGGRKFGTGVLYNGSDHTAGDHNINYVTVDGVDARLVFSVGDKVYPHRSDVAIPGVITKVEQNTLYFSKINSTVDYDNNDGMMCANPIRINLGFER